MNEEKKHSAGCPEGGPPQDGQPCCGEDAKRKIAEAIEKGNVKIGNTAAMEMFTAVDEGREPKTVVRFWINKDAFGFEWGVPKMGFGGASFSLVDVKPNENDPDNICPTGKLYIDDECMGRDFIKEMLCKAVDEAILSSDDKGTA